MWRTISKANRFWLVQGLTVLRVALAFTFVVLAPFADLAYVTAAVYLAAWASDFFDGRLARRWNVASKFGGALDIFGDRYLLVLSCVYVGFRGISLAALSIILVRELFSVAMRMIQIDGRPIIVSNRLVGGAVHALVAVGTVRLLLDPQSITSFVDRLPFLVVAIFYIPYFPYTLYRSRDQIKAAIRAELSGS